MEHRQGPQIDRIAVEPNGDRVAERIQKRTAMVIDDTLGVAGRSRSVVERDRRPTRRRGVASRRRDPPRRERPRIRCRRAARSRSRRRSRRAATGGRARPARARTTAANSRSAISNFACPCPMIKAIERASSRVVQRVEHGSRHRHAEMRFEQRRHVRRHHRDRVAGSDAAPAQRVGEPPATRVEFAIGVARSTVDDRELVGIDRRRRAREKKAASAAKNSRRFAPDAARHNARRGTTRSILTIDTPRSILRGASAKVNPARGIQPFGHHSRTI